MKFAFKAKDQYGAQKEGFIDAYDSNAAVKSIQKEGMVLISIKEYKKGNSLEFRELKRIWEGVSKKEQVIFFRQLAILIDARVPVVQSLSSICDQTSNVYFRLVIKEVISDVEDGTMLSDSLAKHNLVFSPLVVNMIKAGEVSGNLQKSINFIADSIEANYQLTSRIKGALFYPAFVIGVATIIGFIVVTWVLPKLTAIIEEVGADLPFYTEILIWIGKFMEKWWWAVLFAMAAAISYFIYIIRTETGKREWDEWKLKIPVVGTLLKYVYMARFAENFGSLIAGGIPIIRALMVTSEVIGNSVYQKIILKAIDEVKIGGNISSVFAKSKEVPPLVTRMVKIGEESGKTSEVLKKTAMFYNGEVDRMSKNLTSLIEPVMIVILGIGVAIMVFAILMPIYSITAKF